jgi:hypothetical protein
MHSLKEACFSDHALQEMGRRCITKTMVISILQAPDSIHVVREGRIVLHKTFLAENTEKMLLYRVFVDIDRAPPVIVTIYKTSKITKYEKIQ